VVYGGVEKPRGEIGGAPKIKGTDGRGKDAPALYFGSTKINNNFSVVDDVAKVGGAGMAAMLFVKSGHNLYSRSDERSKA